MGQTAIQYGVSRVWVHKLVKGYRQGGWEAVEPGSRRPHQPANATKPATTEQIIALRRRLLAEGLDAGAATIREHLSVTTGRREQCQRSGGSESTF